MNLETLGYQLDTKGMLGRGFYFIILFYYLSFSPLFKIHGLVSQGWTQPLPSNPCQARVNCTAAVSLFLS